MAYQVNFYKNPQQKVSEIESIILDQNSKTQAKIVKTIELLKEFGPFVQMPFSKKLQTNLWELRIKTSEALIRILYTKQDNVFTLLTIFKKKTQKTPVKEIHKALQRIFTI